MPKGILLTLACGHGCCTCHDCQIQLVYEVASAAVAERKEPCDWHVEYPQRPRLATKLTTDLATVAQMLKGMVLVARGRSQQAESGESLRQAVLAFLRQVSEAQAEPWAPSRSVFRGREAGGLEGAEGTTSTSNIKLELPAVLRTHLQVRAHSLRAQRPPVPAHIALNARPLYPRALYHAAYSQLCSY